MYVPKEGEIAVQCPCCRAFFIYPSGHKIASRHQTELVLDPIVEPMFCDNCNDYTVHHNRTCQKCVKGGDSSI